MCTSKFVSITLEILRKIQFYGYDNCLLYLLLKDKKKIWRYQTTFGAYGYKLDFLHIFNICK